MKKNYSRFSLPGRIIDMLYCDDEFYRYVLKDKKAKEHAFPKYNTWRDSDGFHMVFALAGYSASDIKVEASGSELIISSLGAQDDESISFADAPENAKSSVQRGYIVRGIARRKFLINFQISNNFSITNATAQMKDGELHISIPESDNVTTTIKIKYVSSGE